MHHTSSPPRPLVPASCASSRRQRGRSGASTTPPAKWGAVVSLPPGLRCVPPADAGTVMATTVATAIRLLLDLLPSLARGTRRRHVGGDDPRWLGTTERS